MAEVTPNAATLNAADVAVARRATLRTGIPLERGARAEGAHHRRRPDGRAVGRDVRERGRPGAAGAATGQVQGPGAAGGGDLREYRRSDAAHERARGGSGVGRVPSTLFAEGAIAQRDRDNALAALEGARSRLSLAMSQSANAEDRLKSALLTAPAAGVISKRYVQAGDRVDNGKPVLELVDTRVLQLVGLGADRVARRAEDRPAGEPDGGPARLGRRVGPDQPDQSDRRPGDPSDPDLRGRAEPARDAGGRPVRLGSRRDAARSRTRSPCRGSPCATRARTARRTSTWCASGKIARRQVARRRSATTTSGWWRSRRASHAGDTVVIGPIEGLADGTPVAIGAGTRPRRRAAPP